VTRYSGSWRRAEDDEPSAFTATVREFSDRLAASRAEPDPTDAALQAPEAERPTND